MQLIRDYLTFQCQASGTKRGYSKNDVQMSDGPIFNFFGYDLTGLYVSQNKLIIEFDKEINPLGFGIKLGSKPEGPDSPISSKVCKVNEVENGLPFDRVQIYKVIQNELEMTNLKKDQFSSAWNKAQVLPIYDRGVRINDSFVYSDSDNLFQRLEMPAEGLSLTEGDQYIVAFKPTEDLLKEEYGLAEVTLVDADEDFFVSEMRTDIRTATLFVGADNEISVKVFYKNEELSVLNFDRYQLYGITEEPLDTETNASFLKYGKDQGEFVLRLGDVITEPGVYQTSLVGYNNSNPGGVIIWNPSIVKSRLNITAVAK